MPLLLTLTIVATLAMRLALIVVLLEMREPMRARGPWALCANTAALVAAAVLTINSAVAMASWRGVQEMPPLDEIGSRVAIPFVTSAALLLVAVLSAMAMRKGRSG